jgi:hypothetical protein
VRECHEPLLIDPPGVINSGDFQCGGYTAHQFKHLRKPQKTKNMNAPRLLVPVGDWLRYARDAEVLEHPFVLCTCLSEKYISTR